MEVNCALKELAAQPVLSIRTRTSLENLSKVIGESYQAIMGVLQSKGLQPADAPYTAYYNLDMNDLDVEMGFPVVAGTEGNGNIVASEIPAGKYVEAMYVGPYDQMKPVYEDMYKWIEEKGLKAGMPSYEIYYNSPADTPLDKLQTKILWPVK